MLKLYRLSKSQAEAASLVGVDDIERRQHVQQLIHKVLDGCRQGSQPFTWIRAAGLSSIAAALAAGLEDGQALTAVLEATYSQVLEVILSALDRDLIPNNPSAGALAAACQQQGSSGSSSSSVQAADLLAAVGRYPAGYAPAAASDAELMEAFKVLQALCLLHPKARNLLCRAQYLQLVTARACEAPACLPAAMTTLLTLMQGNEEAQGLFVTTGGLDMLLTRTLQHLRTQPQSPTAAAAAGKGSSIPGGSNDGSSGGSSCGDRSAGSSSNGGRGMLEDGGGLSRRELTEQLLLFLHLLQHWVIADAVKAGSHPSTQQAVLSHMVNHLGPDVAATLSQPLTPQPAPAAAAGSSEGGGSAGGTRMPPAAATGAAAAAGGAVLSAELILQQRAEVAAAKLLRRLH